MWYSLKHTRRYRAAHDDSLDKTKLTKSLPLKRNMHVGEEVNFPLVFPPSSTCACLHLVNDVTFYQSKGPWPHFSWKALSVVRSIATTAYFRVL
jgi:hypothetical protein